jgi:hypothetical protein
VTISYKHGTNKITGESKVIFLNKLSLKPFTYVHGFLQQQKLVVLSMFPVKKRYTQFRFIKRLSPFLLSVLLLPAFFVYLFFEEKGIGNNVWVLVSLFVFTEINFLYIDFALWNYFKGKKIFRIWLIEAPLVFFSVYFFL